MNADEIVAEITRRAWSFGAAVLLAPENSVPFDDGLRCAGYFSGDDTQPMLVVAKGSSRWLGTLLHEYSHLTQWAEGAPVWRASENVQWPAWIAGERIRGVQKHIIASRELEADCERRAVRLMRELDAPIDIEQYIRGANAYVHFYNIVAEKRKWCLPERRPYDMPAVLAAANPTLDRDYSKTPKALRALLLECVGD